MEAGRMRETIVISSPPEARDEYGAPGAAEWNEVLSSRASFEPLLGREFFAAQETQSQVEVKFRLRYRPEIQSNYRVVHREINYEIIGQPVNVNGANRELLLYCKKVVM